MHPREERPAGQRLHRSRDGDAPERMVRVTSRTGLTIDGREFRVEPRWKEEVVYWEGQRGYLLDAAWGVEPHVLYVPLASDWDDVVPDWMQGRRDAVLDALRAESGHVLADDVQRFYCHGTRELVSE